jgi:hypothetical protein
LSDGAKHFLLQRSYNLGMLNQFLSGFGKMAGLLERSLES